MVTTIYGSTMAATMEPISALQLLRQLRQQQQQSMRMRREIRWQLSLQDQTNVVPTTAHANDVGGHDGRHVRHLPVFPILMSPYHQHQQQQQQGRYNDDFPLLSFYGGGIIEIVGEAGTGKTQVCLGLLLAAASASAADGGNDDSFAANNATAVSPIPQSTNRYGSNKRSFQNISAWEPPLQSMVCQQQQLTTAPTTTNIITAIYIAMGRAETSSFAQTLKRLQHLANVIAMKDNQDTKSLLKRIHTKCIYNTDELHHLIFYDLPQLLRQQEHEQDRNQRTDNSVDQHRGGVQIIVLDSIGAIFRDDFDGNDNNNMNKSKKYFMQRGQSLFQISQQLKRLSHLYNNVDIIIINQVTAQITTGGGRGETIVAASLGLCWDNCINERYVLSRKEQQYHPSQQQQQHQQQLDKTTSTIGTHNIRINNFNTAQKALFKRFVNVTLSSRLPTTSNYTMTAREFIIDHDLGPYLLQRGNLTAMCAQQSPDCEPLFFL